MRRRLTQWRSTAPHIKSVLEVWSPPMRGEEEHMLTDIFVPPLTYRKPSSVGAFNGLAKLVAPFATLISACTFVVGR